MLGAGLFAANLSTSFRLRKFGMVDLSMYGVSLTLDHVVLAAPAEGQEVEVRRGGAPGQGRWRRRCHSMPHWRAACALMRVGERAVAAFALGMFCRRPR